MDYRFFVERPVFSTVISLIVVLVGLVSFLQLTVREYPNIDEPIVSVRTSYLGAGAEIIETQVTQVLEDSIAGIEGIETIDPAFGLTARWIASSRRVGAES